MDLSGRLADKKIARAALKILFQNLNDKMDEMETIWDDEDEDFMVAINRGAPNWTWEYVKDENFHEGSMPGIINSPPDSFPCVMVSCHEGNPTGSSDDTGELYNYILDIELIAKSGEFTEEYNYDLAHQVTMRLERLKEAVILVLLENRTLNNMVPEISAPRWTTGDVYVRRIEKGKNPKFYYQGASIRYVVNKYLKML